MMYAIALTKFRKAAKLSHHQLRPAERVMIIGSIVLIFLLLVLVGVMPGWNHSRNWGYGPASGISTLMMIIVVMLTL